MEMKNIYFVIHEYSGANTYARQLFYYLQTQEYIRFHIIYLGTSKFRHFTVAEKEDRFVFYIPLTTRQNLTIYSRHVADLLSPWIKGQKNVIVHLNSPNQQYLGKYFKEYFNAKVIYTVHFLMNFFTAEKLESLSPDRDKSGNKETIQLADKVIGVTQFATDLIEKYYAIPSASVSTIHNGYTRDSILLSSQNKKKLKTELGFRNNDILLLFVGRIDVTKGCDKLLAAMNIVLKTYPNLHLVIAGDGNYKNMLSSVRLNCSKIHFTGYLAENELSKLYQIADIGIIPSLWEQCSYVALEMMSYKLPVIYSNVPGLNELFEDDVTGKSIPYYHDETSLGINIKTEDIAEAITALISNPSYRKQLGLQAYKKWNKSFTSGSMGEKTLTQYNALYE